MKKYLQLFLVLFISFIGAQNKVFTITDDGLTKYIVTEIPEITKEMAYKKVIDWANREFNSPQKAIKGMIENQYIRLEAISENAMKYPAIGGTVYLPVKYEIEISLKDEKYKFEIISLQETNYMYPKFSNNEYMEMNLAKTDKSVGYNPIRKSNGEFRNRYKYVSELPVYFNNLNEKLKIHILGSDKTNDDW